MKVSICTTSAYNILSSAKSVVQDLFLLKWNNHRDHTIPFSSVQVFAQSSQECLLRRLHPRGSSSYNANAEGGQESSHPYVPYHNPIQEALDIKPESIKCTFTIGAETHVMVWSGHSTNEQLLLHVKKAYSTTKKMGLDPKCNDTAMLLELKKHKLKAI